MHIPIRGAERFRHDPFPARGKDSKTLVLAAFFPPFLSPQKERVPQEAAQVGLDYGDLCEKIVELSLAARKAART